MTSPGTSPSAVAVVTDSTAYLPADLAEKYAVTVVPLTVVMGGTAYDEGTGVTPAEVAHALRTYTPVSTSRPAPEVLAAHYRELAGRGASAVVSVHLSAEMSGTYEAALLAARQVPVPVHVVDSRSLGMGLGFAALAAARAATAGEAAESVVAAAHRCIESTSVLFYVDTLEHLRRGGRIGAAQAVLGSALSVKPLLHLQDGRIAPLEKVRTTARAIARLEDLAAERAGEGPVDVAVQHLAAEARAHDLAARLSRRLPGVGDVPVSEVGAVVGAHVGPGMLAVAVTAR